MKKTYFVIATLFLFFVSVFSKENKYTKNSRGLILKSYSNWTQSCSKRSHVSHYSSNMHYSHYSSMFVIKNDSIDNLSTNMENEIRRIIAKEYECDVKYIKIEHIYKSKNNNLYRAGYNNDTLIKKYEGEGLYINFEIIEPERIIHFGRRSITRSYECLIPLSSKHTTYFIYKKELNTDFKEERIPSWVVDVKKIVNKK